MKYLKKINKSDLTKILLTYVIIIIIALSTVIFLKYRFNHIRLEKEAEISLAETKNKSHLTQFLSDIIVEETAHNLLLIKNSNEFTDFLVSNNPVTRNEVSMLFVRMLQNTSLIDQLRYIDKDGMEIVRVNNIDGSIEITETNDLQDKSNRDYFKEIIKLNDNEIYVNDLSLNVENGEIETPYRSITQIGTPLFVDGQLEGILVINIEGEDLLADLVEKDLINYDHDFKIINEDGYFLFSEDEDELYGHIVAEHADQNLFDMYPEVETAIKNQPSGYIRNSELIITFVKITPFSSANTNTTWHIVEITNLNDLGFFEGNIVYLFSIDDIFISLFASLLLFILILFVYFARKRTNYTKLTEKIAEETSDSVVISDENENISFVNKAFEKTTGRVAENIIGSSTRNLQAGIHSREFYQEMWKKLHKEKRWTGEVWDIKANDVLYPKRMTILSISAFSGKAKRKRFISISSDLSKIAYTNNHVFDSTNISIKYPRLYQDLFDSVLRKNEFSESNLLGVVCLHIKHFNFKYSDKTIINALTNLINAYIYDKKIFIATISRETVIIGLTGIQSKMEIIELLTPLLQTTIVKDETLQEDILIDMKAGIAVYPDEFGNNRNTIEKAFYALEYNSKKNLNKIEFFSNDALNSIEREIKIEYLLRNKHVKDELSMMYQPKIDSSSNSVIGYEALCRWNSNILGPVSPYEFITVAEKSGQIVHIGNIILEKVFKDLSHFPTATLSNKRISINLSVHQFLDRELETHFINLSKKYHVDLRHIEIEITESLFSENLKIINNKLFRFKQLGVTIAIDDFGTGYSSLSYLKQLNLDILKIDRSFIKDYPVSEESKILKTIIDLARDLNLDIICEGVETESQIQYLSSLGVFYIQGYYYSKPLLFKDIIEFEENLTTSKN